MGDRETELLEQILGRLGSIEARLSSLEARGCRLERDERRLIDRVVELTAERVVERVETEGRRRRRDSRRPPPGPPPPPPGRGPERH